MMRSPWGQTMMATLLKHRDAPVPSLAETRPEVPDALDAVFRRMMAKATAERYQTMSEVVGALETVRAGLGETISGLRPALAPFPDTSAAAPLPSPSQNFEMSWDDAPVPAGQTIDQQQNPTYPDMPRSVLLVEPSRTQSAIIRKYLQAEGVQKIVAVASGQEALQVVRTDSPNAILSALHLSDMTGVQLAERVREEYRGAAPGFVLISTESEAEQAGTLSKCGQAVLLHKPFTPEQLVEALRAVSAVLPFPSRTAQPGKLRVLIVDDSAAARLHARVVLQRLGLTQFVEAADGAQAVAATAREPFDLIITDYNMPHMDGRGLVGYLKQNPSTSSIPIILVTTEQDPGKLEAMHHLGVAAICDKNLPAEVVAKIIDQLVKVP